MKKFIFCLSMILVFGCKEISKKANNNKDKGHSSEKTIQKEKSTIDYENQIVPGKRLASIILYQNATAVTDSLGKPYLSDAAMGKAISTWGKDPDNILTLFTTTKMGVEDFSRIKAIRIISPDYRTEDNLGANSTLKELKRYYKLDYTGKFTYNGKHYMLYITNKGIAFEIGMNQKCHGVLLYSKNTDPEDFYLPIYPNFKKKT